MSALQRQANRVKRKLTIKKFRYLPTLFAYSSNYLTNDYRRKNFANIQPENNNISIPTQRNKYSNNFKFARGEQTYCTI